jgi:hypothetical protein
MREDKCCVFDEDRIGQVGLRGEFQNITTELFKGVYVSGMLRAGDLQIDGRAFDVSDLALI